MQRGKKLTHAFRFSPLIFTEGQESQIWLRYSTPDAFEMFGFWDGETYRKFKNRGALIMDLRPGQI